VRDLHGGIYEQTSCIDGEQDPGSCAKRCAEETSPRSLRTLKRDVESSSGERCKRDVLLERRNDLNPRRLTMATRITGVLVYWSVSVSAGSLIVHALPSATAAISAYSKNVWLVLRRRVRKSLREVSKSVCL
jgi:hypothetical protein